MRLEGEYKSEIIERTVMTTYTEQYYSIGEVLQMLDVPIYTLRFWENQFPIPG